MIVSDAPLESGRTAGRFDAAYESHRGERMEGFIHGLQGDMANTIAHPRGERLDVEVVTVPDGLQQRDAGRGHPEAGLAQLPGRGRSLGRGHGANVSR